LSDKKIKISDFEIAEVRNGWSLALLTKDKRPAEETEEHTPQTGLSFPDPRA